MCPRLNLLDVTATMPSLIWSTIIFFLGCPLVVMTDTHHLLTAYRWLMNPICAQNVRWHIGHMCSCSQIVWWVMETIFPLLVLLFSLGFTIGFKLCCAFANRSMPWTPVLGHCFPGFTAEISFLQVVFKTVLDPFLLTASVSMPFYKFTYKNNCE